MATNKEDILQASFEKSANPEAFNVSHASLIGGTSNTIKAQQEKKNEHDRAKRASYVTASQAIQMDMAEIANKIADKHNFDPKLRNYIKGTWAPGMQNLCKKAPDMSKRDLDIAIRNHRDTLRNEMDKNPVYDHLSPEEKDLKAAESQGDLAKQMGSKEVLEITQKHIAKIQNKITHDKGMIGYGLSGQKPPPPKEGAENAPNQMSHEDFMKLPKDEQISNFSEMLKKQIAETKTDLAKSKEYFNDLDELYSTNGKTTIGDNYRLSKDEKDAIDEAQETLHTTIKQLENKVKFQEGIIEFINENKEFLSQENISQEDIINKALDEKPELFSYLAKSGMGLNEKDKELLEQMGIKDAEGTIAKFQRYGKIATLNEETKAALKEYKDAGCETMDDIHEYIYKHHDESQSFLTRKMGTVGDKISKAAESFRMETVTYTDPKTNITYKVKGGTDGTPHYEDKNGETHIITDKLALAEINHKIYGADGKKPYKFDDYEPSSGLIALWNKINPFHENKTIDEINNDIDKNTKEAQKETIEKTTKEKPQEKPAEPTNATPQILALKGAFTQARDEKPKTELTSMFEKAEAGLEQAAKFIAKAITPNTNDPKTPAPAELEQTEEVATVTQKIASLG